MKKLRYVFLCTFTTLFLSVGLTGCALVDLFTSHASPDTETVPSPVKPTNTAPKEYKKGILTENRYESEFLGLKFLAPKGYAMTQEIDLKDTNEMEAKAPAGIPTINLSVEKSRRTVDEEIDLFKSEGKKDLNLAYFTFEDDVMTIDLINQSYKKISGKGMGSGITQYKDIYMKKCDDDRIVRIIVTYTTRTRAEAQTLIKSFFDFSESF